MNGWLERKSRRRSGTIGESKRNTLSQVTLYFLKTQPPILESLRSDGAEPFIIDSFGGDHGASYVIKTLDGKPAPNTQHTVITCVYSALEKDICARLMRSRLGLRVTYASKERKIKTLQVMFLVCFMQFSAPLLPPREFSFFARSRKLAGIITAYIHLVSRLRWGQRICQRGSCGAKAKTANTKLMAGHSHHPSYSSFPQLVSQLVSSIIIHYQAIARIHHSPS